MSEATRSAQSEGLAGHQFGPHQTSGNSGAAPSAFDCSVGLAGIWRVGVGVVGGYQPTATAARDEHLRARAVEILAPTNERASRGWLFIASRGPRGHPVVVFQSWRNRCHCSSRVCSPPPCMATRSPYRRGRALPTACLDMLRASLCLRRARQRNLRRLTRHRLRRPRHLPWIPRWRQLRLEASWTRSRDLSSCFSALQFLASSPFSRKAS